MLTDAQRQLAEDNHKLIYSFLHKGGWPVDDYYDIAAIGLCKAARYFDPGRGIAFSAFAYKCMANELWMVDRNSKTRGKAEYSTVSLDAALTDEADSGLRGDIIKDGRYILEDEVICKDLLSCIKNLEPRLRNIIRLKAAGYTQSQIAAHLGMSQANVSRQLAKARKIIA